MTACGAACDGLEANFSHVDHGELGNHILYVDRGKLSFKHVFKRPGQYAVVVHARPGQVYDFEISFSGMGQLSPTFTPE